VKAIAPSSVLPSIFAIFYVKRYAANAARGISDPKKRLLRIFRSVGGVIGVKPLYKT
jgi:hypothetical protein